MNKETMNRREFIGATVAASAALSLPGISFGAASGKGKRPNILLITTDQQHARLMSCAGDSYVNTPNLDKLAASGIRFENAYCANPVCVPSRYSMLSGYMPHVFDDLETNRKKTKEKPLINDYINTPTLGTIFKEAGYETIYGGKLHVEGHQFYTPEREASFGFRSLIKDDRKKLVREAAVELRQRRDKPFLMWVSLINPHDICYFPYQDKESAQGYALKLHEKYLDKLHRQFPDTPLPPLPENFELSGDEIEWVDAHQKGKVGNSGLNRTYGSSACKWSDEFWQEYRWAYRRYMEIVDEEIGTLLQGLKDAGLEENTIIVFTSDHGDHDGAHKLTMKRSFYEESANIPLIVSWPGHCVPGAVDSSTLVNNGPDLIPTLCDLAGIEPPKELNGVSFRPAAEGRPVPRDFIVGQTNTGRMLRTAQYKYNVYHVKGRSEEQLFDMQSDRAEMQNLARKAEFADVLKDHREKLQAWVVENNDAKGQGYLAAL